MANIMYITLPFFDSNYVTTRFITKATPIAHINSIAGAMQAN